MKAAEQLANVRGRLGWEIVDKALRNLDEMKKREQAAGRTSKARAAARRARVDAERSLRQAVERADDLIDAVTRAADEADRGRTDDGTGEPDRVGLQAQGARRRRRRQASRGSSKISSR